MVKFLVIRFSSIGDIVLTTPVVRCLKIQSEDFIVHYLTKPQFASLVEDNPYIDKVHVLKKNFKEMIDELKAENFDYIIDLHRNIRTLRVKNALKRISFAFNKLNFKKWLIVNLKINKLPDLHIVERYFKTVQVFSVENDNKGLDFFINKNDEQHLQTIQGIPDKPFLAIAVGGGHFTKQIPVEKLIFLIENVSVPIVLLGGKEDIPKANEICNSTKESITNFTGSLTIIQSAAVVKEALLLLTPDTGLMHIAAAFKKNILSLWGNTIPEFGMYPYLPGDESKVYEVKGLTCRPCSKIGHKKCPKKHFNCMYKQDYNTIIDTINKHFLINSSN
jgi:ADP-heptose:LPS heptosyltransferase